MSFVNTISRIGTYYYETFRDEMAQERIFPESLDSRKRLLVIMPRNPEERSGFLSEYEALYELSREITFIGIDIPDFDQKEISNCVTLDKDQLLLGVFPRMAGLEALSGKVFEASIDTNSTFDLASALLPMKAGIATRIGFAQDYGPPFYNIGFWGNSVSEFTKFWKDVTGAKR